LIIGCCIAFLYFGIAGVTQMRDLFARYSTIHIPTVWYWFAIVPQLVVAVLTVTLPEAAFRWRRGAIAGILILTSIIAGGTSPLLYIVYDYEHNIEAPVTESSSASENAQHALQPSGAEDSRTENQ